MATESKAATTLPKLIESETDDLVSGVMRYLLAQSTFYEVVPFIDVPDKHTVKTHVTERVMLTGDKSYDVSSIADKSRQIGRTHYRSVTDNLRDNCILRNVTDAKKADLSLSLLDEPIENLDFADFIMMNARSLRKFFFLLRELGGSSVGERITLPSGASVPSYQGIPIFRNDNLTNNIIVGALDDGSSDKGLAVLANTESPLVQIEYFSKSHVDISMYTGIMVPHRRVAILKNFHLILPSLSSFSGDE